MRGWGLLVGAAGAWLASGGAGLAQEVRLEGYLVALSPCEATQRLTSGNPGSIRLEPMRAYAMVARNNTPGTHYRIRVPGAPVTQERWVATSCGAFAPQDMLVVPAGPSGPVAGAGGSAGSASLPPNGIEAVLAASWEPAFCATGAGQGKAECTSLKPGRFDATHFALHGLWPDDLDDRAIFPCYCDRGAPVSCGGSQARDTSIALSASVLADLSVAMPGVQSGLHLHEWGKHGACYEDDRTDGDKGATPDEFYGEAMALMARLNASPVQALFAAHVGEVLSRQQIEAAFEQAFGAGAGDRVLIRCSRVGGENVIAELWIGLKGDITASPDFGALLMAAPDTRTSTEARSCNSGRVVKVAER